MADEAPDPHATTRRPDKPLSKAPVVEEPRAGGGTSRVDMQGRVLCGAKRRDGELCKSPAVTGLRVCRMHGASTPQARNAVKLRLTELVTPAIATLAREMTNADKSADRQRAANSILDRAGHGRAQKMEVEDAKGLLYQKLLELNEQTPDDEPAGEER